MHRVSGPSPSAPEAYMLPVQVWPLCPSQHSVWYSARSRLAWTMQCHTCSTRTSCSTLWAAHAPQVRMQSKAAWQDQASLSVSTPHISYASFMTCAAGPDVQSLTHVQAQSVLAQGQQADPVLACRFPSAPQKRALAWWTSCTRIRLHCSARCGPEQMISWVISQGCE